jgi:AcrR family transcriptional regulator
LAKANPGSVRGPDRRTRRRGASASLDRLLEGARAVFAERGYGAANIHEICARANVGIGTFYAHFDHKRDLLQRVFVERVLQSGTLTPDDVLDHARLVAVVARAADDPEVAGLLRAWYEAVAEEPELARSHSEWRPRTLTGLTATIAEAQKRSPAKGRRLDPSVVAWTMATLAREMAIHDRTGAPDIDTLARLFEDLAFGTRGMD